MTKAVEPTEYWFARRFPLSNPRQSMAPVHWKGWLVVASFLAAMLIGAAAFAWYANQGEMMKGAAYFVMAAFMGGLWFISVARFRGDRIRSVKDYQRGKPIV
jgi:hypothetical protein